MPRVHFGSLFRKFLRPLFRDENGNTLVMVAVAIFPMLLMIGGGLDVARAYLTQARMGQACDAAALAGRRAMTGEDITTAQPEALKFFNHGFPQGFMSSAAFTPQVTRPAKGTVRVAAQSTVPTTIMTIFGYDSIPISVSCDATQNFDNIDIVLVLDTTGSMDDTLNGEKKIVSLRKAVMALYDELATAQSQLEAQGLRLRYSIVPYSSTVNVGYVLKAASNDYIADSWEYQSRRRQGGKWVYEPRTYNVTDFKAGNEVNARDYYGGSWDDNETWNGCIEERTTTNSITASGGNSVSDIPSAAKDLDIDLIPSSNATRWGPQWKDVSYQLDGDEASRWCPTEAKRLQKFSRSQMDTYTKSLSPDGPTYLDAGMIWGARMISRGGVFGGDNPTVHNSRPVNRYVIFMTDGKADPSDTNLSMYGIEYLANRVKNGGYGVNVADGTSSDLAKRHLRRFVMACNQAKSGGASIWTIAFGTSMTTELTQCASSSDQTATSANSTQLINKFKEIGKNIGTLRLSQ